MPEAWKFWEGRVVGERFPLRQYLGGSDHSAVFLTDLGQGSDRAAIKLISVDPNQSTTQLRILEVAKKLSHPFLLRIFHAGQCQLDETALLYAVMEYAEENLSQILPDRALTPVECGELLPSVLEALSYMHSQGLVHGRLQPANIMASGDQLKLASDGVRAIGETGGDVNPSIYVPPEIVSGAPWLPAADVWSLGVTLVEVLTQRPPMNVGSDDPAVPKSMPAPLREIAEHCLVRDPQRRWTIPEIVARLHPNSLTSEKQTITPPRKRSSGKLTAAGAAACLLLVILVGASLVSRHPNTQPRAAIAESPENPSGANSTAMSPTPPPALVEQSLPDVPASARITIQGKVKVSVKVSVDTSGNVVGARLASAGPSKYFANLALRAARGCKFTPPQKDGQNVGSEWILNYEFGRAGTSVQPAQASP